MPKSDWAPITTIGTAEAPRFSGPDENRKEDVKVDNYQRLLPKVGDLNLSFNERMKAVEELRGMVTGATSVCSDSDGKKCWSYKYIPVYEFGDAPASPNAFIFKYAKFFSDSLVEELKKNLEGEKDFVQASLSTSKKNVVCEVTDDDHFKTEIVCEKKHVDVSDAGDDGMGTSTY